MKFKYDFVSAFGALVSVISDPSALCGVGDAGSGVDAK
jgi:hypothetical protein